LFQILNIFFLVEIHLKDKM